MQRLYIGPSSKNQRNSFSKQTIKNTVHINDILLSFAANWVVAILKSEKQNSIKINSIKAVLLEILLDDLSLTTNNKISKREEIVLIVKGNEIIYKGNCELKEKINQIPTRSNLVINAECWKYQYEMHNEINVQA